MMKHFKNDTLYSDTHLELDALFQMNSQEWSHGILTLIFLAAVTSITLENETGFSKKKRFNNIWSLMEIPLYGLCVCIAEETFSNRKKRCLINRFMNRIGILRGVHVYVFNSMSFFKQLSD